METFNAIPIFVSVADNKGFSPAARELGISKSAVSKRISQLEDQLGIRLFHRSTRTISMTEAGERFYEYAAQATRAAQNAEDVVSELQGEPKGLIKIWVPMSFGQLHVAPLIPRFLLKYPKTRIELVMDDKPRHLLEEGFDLAIHAGELPNSTLIARKLTTLRSTVCCSAAYYRQHQQQLLSPQSLLDMNCILYSYSGNSDLWSFYENRNGGTEYQIQVKGNYRVNNSIALKEALLNDLGIGRLPTFVAGEYLKNGKLVQLFNKYTMPTKSMYTVYPERRYMPAKVKAFSEYAFEYFGGENPYWDAF